MYTCEITNETKFTKKARFFNPKCGHQQEFQYSAPNVCQKTDCMALVPDNIKKLFDMDKSIGEDAFQMSRVKYFVESSVK